MHPSAPWRERGWTGGKTGDRCSARPVIVTGLARFQAFAPVWWILCCRPGFTPYADCNHRLRSTRATIPPWQRFRRLRAFPHGPAAPRRDLLPIPVRRGGADVAGEHAGRREVRWNCESSQLSHRVTRFRRRHDLLHVAPKQKSTVRLECRHGAEEPFVLKKGHPPLHRLPHGRASCVHLPAQLLEYGAGEWSGTGDVGVDARIFERHSVGKVPAPYAGK
jgi:hypothetical protein